MSAEPHPDPLDLLTIRQVMAVTKLSRSSVVRDINRGLLRTVKLGASVRVLRSELERYIQAGQQ